MEIHRLQNLDGFIVFDLDGCPLSAGGTRFAPDVTEEETALLARAMTYKFAVLERQLGGAKGAVRGPAASKPDLMRRYCDEVRPLIQGGRFLTGPDLGTSEADFASLRAPDTGARLMASSLGGIPFEDLLTGYGVVAAVEAAAGPLSGLSFAVEGFGKVGGGVAREAVRRGARVVAVSTIEGCVHDPAGLDVELLLQLRAAHGDGFVRHAGRPALDVAALFDTTADVLVPGARTGSVTAEVAERLRVRWVAPAANVPYTSGGLDALRARGIRALPDFVCNAGAVLGYMAPEDCGPGEVFRIVETRLSDLVQRASLHPGGYVEGACEMAEAFLRTWRDELPDGRPLA